MSLNDLSIDKKSSALAGVSVDIVVSGSIAAVESVKFIRSLRRLGADVFVYLTSGGAQFITPMALEWASTHPVVTVFEGAASHLATHDACVIAPASANFIAHVAHGLTGSPATALVASYLGQKKKVFVVPSMHDSLMDSPHCEENIKRILPWTTILTGPREEGKRKFPQPDVLADTLAHEFNYRKTRGAPVLITMGTTRGYIDDVRYFSNYSSGRLGTLIAEEFYRNGFATDVIAGPALHRPLVYTRLSCIETNEELLSHALHSVEEGAGAAIFAASVLDFIPEKKVAGKIHSDGELAVTFRKAEKIIGRIQPKYNLKVGFKLETSLNSRQMHDIARSYIEKYDLRLMVFNLLANVDENRHTATIFEKNPGSVPICRGEITSKAEIARFIVDHVKQAYPS